MAVKLDMSKAYGRMKWDFLETMLGKLGFGGRWIKLLMACVKSITYSMVVNGVPSDVILPSRWLRQGDPLSSYLFLICAKGFSVLLQQVELGSLIKGLATSRGGIRINHI